MKQFLLYFLAFSLVFIACKKDTSEPPVETNYTVLLTRTPWQIKHLHQAQGGQKAYYDRGGQNNTFDYSNDLLEFENDGSGTYTTSAGIAYNITWQFDNTDKTELSYVIHAFGGGDFNIKLENIVLNENSFRYAEMYSYSGTYAGGAIYRIPKP